MKGLFSSSRTQAIPRPALWRLIPIQCAVWLAVVIPCAVFWPDYAPSFFWAGVISLLAQTVWLWRIQRAFGDPHSTGFLAGTVSGMIAKWVILAFGLVLLWRNLPGVSVAITLVTVIGLNTLAALIAPIVISRRR